MAYIIESSWWGTPHSDSSVYLSVFYLQELELNIAMAKKLIVFDFSNY